MKQMRFRLFGSIALAAVMASCASLDKMKEAAVDQIMGEEDTVWVEFKNHRNNSGEE